MTVRKQAPPLQALPPGPWDSGGIPDQPFERPDAHGQVKKNNEKNPQFLLLLKKNFFF